VLLSLHLELPAVPDWADGRDAEGRAVVLVGAHALRALPEGAAAVAAVLDALGAGEVPAGVHAVAYAPKASAAFATITAGEGVREVMLDGPRGSGKTQVVPGALAWLAELHRRAEVPLPLQVLWLHDSLTTAAMKTARSLEEPLWGGLWSIREGGAQPVLTVGGVEYVVADFVPTEDVQAAERARAACHVVVAEEAIASISEGGIEERKYELALSSMPRLPTPRRVAIVTTNPGSPTSWPYLRFIEPGRAGCVRCEIPASDRLTPEQQRALIESFRNSPDLQRRLAGGEWCGLQLGAQVATAYNPATHVAPRRLEVAPFDEVWMGWDSGGGAHCHATVIGQRVGAEVRVYACLVSEETGLAQHLESRVLPWIERRMPSLLDRGASDNRLLHRYDPTMDTGEGGDIELDAVRRVRHALGGSFRPGPVRWPERIDALMTLLNQGNGRGGMALQIDPGEDTALLRRALAGEWYYAVMRGGQVVRDLPAKPTHPWEDCGDAMIYFAAGVAPLRAADDPKQRQKYATTQSNPWQRPGGETENRRAKTGAFNLDR
jgi:hypothetical protein